MSGKKTILIIEDDLAYGEMLYETIRSNGYDAHLAYSATGGIDIIKREKLDLIISDVNMPEMDGVQIAEQIAKMYLDIPIVLLTSINDLELVRRALEIGVVDYLVKPTSLNELPIVIEKNITRNQLKYNKSHNLKTPILIKALKLTRCARWTQRMLTPAGIPNVLHIWQC